MVLVLFLIGVTILFLTLNLLISNLWFEIEIKNLKVEKEKNAHTKINKDYQIILYGYLFKKIKAFKIKLNKTKISEKYIRKISDKLNNRTSFLNFKSFLSNLKDLKERTIELETLQLELSIGSESVFVTSSAVTLISSIISILLPNLINNFDRKKYNYQVIPIYNKNKIELFLESRIKINFYSAIKLIVLSNQGKEIDSKSMNV